MNILLMGARACGKSTIGRCLAAQVGMPFVDLDELVLAGFGHQTVRGAWAGHRQATWRRAEAAALADVLSQEGGQVVALGGGTPMISSARNRIHEELRAGRATTVYLRCAVEELQRRLVADTGDRPPLQGVDVVGEVPAVLSVREPVYRALADIEVDVTAITPAGAAEAIATFLARRQSSLAEG